MNLQEILCLKGTDVQMIEPRATLDAVVRELVRHNIGSLVVCEPDVADAVPHAVGIITERDILRSQAAAEAPLEQLRVAGVMARRLVTASPDDSIEHAMGQMTRQRVRHLPIVTDGRVLGMVSIGDVVKAQYDALVTENHLLRWYIGGEGGEVAVPPPHG